MAKITDFEFMGTKGNLFDIGSWTKLVLGAFMLMSTFALGQNLFKKAGSTIPRFDGTIEPIMDRPQQTNKNLKRYV